MQSFCSFLPPLQVRHEGAPLATLRPGDVFAWLLQPLHPPFVACCRPLHARHVLFLLRLTLPRWPARCAARGRLTTECGGRLVVWRAGGQPARRGPEHGGGVPRSAAEARAERRPPPRAPMGGAGRPLQPEVRRPHPPSRGSCRAVLHPSIRLPVYLSLSLARHTTALLREVVRDHKLPERLEECAPALLGPRAPRDHRTKSPRTYSCRTRLLLASVLPSRAPRSD